MFLIHLLSRICLFLLTWIGSPERSVYTAFGSNQPNLSINPRVSVPTTSESFWETQTQRHQKIAADNGGKLRGVSLRFPLILLLLLLLSTHLLITHKMVPFFLQIDHQNRSSETFRVFSSSGETFNFGFGFFDSPARPLPPPPPSVEVLSTEVFSILSRSLLFFVVVVVHSRVAHAPCFTMFRVCLEEKLGIFLGFLSLIELVVKQASTSVKYTVEPVNFDGLTLLKVTLF